ncbi:MAG TPA: type III polyketide synthase [Arsenicitalea sp.]|jgi:predicted naringenin-chalcone synthase|nr:type III polyketide synthase [Arsenicitalea sp.]
MTPQAYVNKIATAVPPHDVHRFFLGFAASELVDDPRRQAIFNRMADKGGIEHRYSCFASADDPNGPTVDAAGLFRRGSFPGTAVRMDMFAASAPALAQQAVDGLGLGEDAARITHLIVTTCTGFSAPGIDLEIIARCGLASSVERTIIGFMGCYAAVNALKLARHIVRSDPAARVLTVNVELCTLHLKETTDLERLLSFCLWGDGCAAALVTAEPTGIALDSFHAIVAENSRELMTWSVRDDGFDMVLSGQVPAAIHDTLSAGIGDILGNRGLNNVDIWAIHPGGKSVLDAVERALALEPEALRPSREVLRRNGNMSSATVMFVLAQILADRQVDKIGCAMAFGPGLTAETMMFHTADAA